MIDKNDNRRVAIHTANHTSIRVCTLGARGIPAHLSEKLSGNWGSAPKPFY